MIETLVINMVSIIISPALVIVISSSPNSGKIDLMQQATFTGTVYGGSGGYIYWWTETPPGCSNTGTSVMTCVPTSAGNFTVALQVTDSNLNILATIIQYTVDQDPIVTLSADHQSLDAGQSTTLTATATLGSGSYSYVWTGLPSNCLIKNGNVATCNPSPQGTYFITVGATDSNQYTATSNHTTLIVYPDPMVKILASASSVLLGEKITLTAKANGGFGAYSYSWSGLPPGCVASNSSAISCTPSATGTFSVSVTLKDSLGWKTSTAVSLTIEEAFLGLPATEGYSLTLIVLAAIFIGVILVMRRLIRRAGRLTLPSK